MTIPVKVLLVDDHAVVRAGYRHLLQSDSAIEIVAEANDAASAYEAFSRLAPDVVVMDISLPGISGIEAMRRMLARRPQARVLIFSMHDESIFIARALKAGACGFVSKSSAAETLVQAVHAVARGERYLSRDAPQIVALDVRRDASAERLNDLSPREFEVFRLLVQGLALSEIGVRLGLSDKTVANYQSQVRQKLGVHNDVQLVRLAERIWPVTG
jgi:two-component system, NarL family, invasion response regulator UvrY